MPNTSTRTGAGPDPSCHAMLPGQTSPLPRRRTRRHRLHRRCRRSPGNGRTSQITPAPTRTKTTTRAARTTRAPMAPEPCSQSVTSLRASSLPIQCLCRVVLPLSGCPPLPQELATFPYGQPAPNPLLVVQPVLQAFDANLAAHTNILGFLDLLFAHAPLGEEQAPTYPEARSPQLPRWPVQAPVANL